jgi:hypothetical protein
MINLWNAFEYLLTFLQCYALVLYLDRKYVKRDKPLPSLLVFCGVIWVAIYVFAHERAAYFDLWLFALPFLYSVIALKGKWYDKLVSTCFLAIASVGVTTLLARLFTSVPGIAAQAYYVPSLYRFVCLVAITAARYLVFYLGAIKRTQLNPTNKIALALFALINLFSVGIMIGLFAIWSAGDGNDLLISCMLLFAMLISAASLFFYDLMTRYINEKFNVRNQADLISSQKSRMDELQYLYISLDKIKHDFKSQIQTVSKLIEKGELSKGREYLEEVKSNTLMLFSTNNPVVDSLLTIKYTKMNEHNIPFTLKANDLSALPISDYRLCVVISNLLDNAIEAIARSELKGRQREIRLNVERLKETLYIHCVNFASEGYVKRKGDRFISSQQRGHQGYGIENIRLVAEQADGFADFKYERGQFTAKILIPYPETTNRTGRQFVKETLSFVKRSGHFGRPTYRFDLQSSFARLSELFIPVTYTKWENSALVPLGVRFMLGSIHNGERPFS